MGSNLIIALNVVLPLFFCMALGYMLRQIRMVDEHTLDGMNRLCFKVFLPILLFRNIYTTNLTDVFNGKLVIYSVCGIFILFLALLFVIPLMDHENARRGVLVQGIMRSNFVLFGLPIATNLCGADNVGITSLLIGIVVPLFNVLSVVALETFRGGRPDARKILKGIVTNPLILASALAVLFYFLHIRLPGAVEQTVADLAKVATPLSLVVLGGFFTFRAIRGYRRQLLIGVLGKLVLSPLLFVTGGVLLGFRGVELISLMIMFGSPTAVSSFTMARQMGGDGDLAAELVVFTTGVSILTIFLWIFALKTLAFI